MDIRATIENNYLADGMPASFIDMLASLATVRRFLDGEPIVHQFDTGCDLMLLKFGWAKILAVTGEEIGEIHPGMPFGEMALIDGRPRAATVLSVGSTEVVFLDGEGVKRLFRAKPRMANIALNNLCRVLCHRLRSSNQHMAVLLTLGASAGQDLSI